MVTGASAGIGRAFAEQLAARGCHLVVVARDGARLDELATRLRASAGVEVDVVPADLTASEELRRVVNRLAAAPAIDLLVNNAGFSTLGKFATLDVEREANEIALNVVAPVRLTRAVLPGMLERRRGAVINVSSLAAFLPGPNLATYSSTKAYLNSFTEALHDELRGTGVRVQVLCPGLTRTEFHQRAGIDASGRPGFAWMSADEVVRISLEKLQMGSLVVVPGWMNQVFRFILHVGPRGPLRRANGRMVRQ